MYSIYPDAKRMYPVFQSQFFFSEVFPHQIIPDVSGINESNEIRRAATKYGHVNVFAKGARWKDVLQILRGFLASQIFPYQIVFMLSQFIDGMDFFYYEKGLTCTLQTENACLAWICLSEMDTISRL